MKIREAIFDSESERQVFRSLQTRWARTLALYPGLSLPKLIDIRREEVERGEWEFYLTSNFGKRMKRNRGSDRRQTSSFQIA